MQQRNRGAPLLSALPPVTLNNGVDLPAIGLGVFQSPPEETAGAVEAAIATGYRLIDTAAAYANEREVGEGIRRSGIDRAEVFIETKVWISDYGYDATLHAFDKSARKLGVDQLDLLLLHQPLSVGLRPDARRLPGAREAARRRQGARDRRQQLHARAPRAPAGRDVRRARREPDRGPSVLPADRAAAAARRARHPDPGLVAHRRHHLLPAAPRRARSTTRRCVEIARQHGKSAAQVMLRWHLQAGTLRDPEVDQARPHRRELRRLRLRALQRAARRDRRARHRRARRTGARQHQPRELRHRDPRGVRPLPRRRTSSGAIAEMHRHLCVVAEEKDTYNAVPDLPRPWAAWRWPVRWCSARSRRRRWASPRSSRTCRPRPRR